MATIFTWLMICIISTFYSQMVWLVREIKLPMQEFELRMQGAYVRGGGM